MGASSVLPKRGDVPAAVGKSGRTAFLSAGVASAIVMPGVRGPLARSGVAGGGGRPASEMKAGAPSRCSVPKRALGGGTLFGTRAAISASTKPSKSCRRTHLPSETRWSGG